MSDDEGACGRTTAQDAAVRAARLGPMQRIAAAHLLKSHLETAPITLLGEVEVDALVAFRETLNADAHRDHGLRFSLTALLVKIAAQALREHPALNATFVDGNVHVAGAVHMGVAMSMPDDNLIVPVIRNADQLTLAEVSIALADLGQRAMAGRLALDDVRGATFTLTNPGGLRTARWSTPIVALPQCAILGVGALARRAVVREERIVPAWVLPTSLTVDHRVVNGVPAQRFVDTLHALLSEPAKVQFGASGGGR
ncbi:MAG TPA: 2-oxo acid dehydrogenase subunit E2 [Burkholderiaceae bacterium]|jgi:pyruvate dehydrogenase E2 component (dihydrolipoamide acetyltransferase)|nr:2-oxo acid dehydrogenase subunit E2 [Burkholderiaceae bacterium]